MAAYTQLPSLRKKKQELEEEKQELGEENQELGEQKQELGEQKQELRRENQEDGWQEGRKRKASDSEAGRQNRSKVLSRRGTSSRPPAPGPTDASFEPESETLPVITGERRMFPGPAGLLRRVPDTLEKKMKEEDMDVVVASHERKGEQQQVFGKEKQVTEEKKQVAEEEREESEVVMRGSDILDCIIPASRPTSNVFLGKSEGRGKNRARKGQESVPMLLL